MEPQMNADERGLNELTERIIACIYAVSNHFGCGFLERVYENALFVELTRRGLRAELQKAFTLKYHDAVVGEYFADLIVERLVLVEVKAVKGLDDVHMAQCLNYMRSAGLRLCLLVNFAKPKVAIRRLVNNL